MNALTAEQITLLASEVNPLVTLHPATIAYVRLLIKPYAETVDPEPIDVLRLWVSKAFTGTQRRNIVDRMNDTLAKFPQADTEHEATVAAREAIIKSLLSEIMIPSAEAALDMFSNVVWPWDVQYVIFAYSELRRIFGYPEETTESLPVKITIGGQKFSYDLTMEFVAGLLLFSDVGKIDFSVTMFGAPFTTKDVAHDPLKETGSRFENKDVFDEGGDDEKDTLYSVKVNDVKYIFETPNFMRGFVTGAQWAGVDHHAYWEGLTQVTIDNGIVETEITF